MLLIKNIEFGCLDFNHHNYFNEKNICGHTLNLKRQLKI